MSDPLKDIMATAHMDTPIHDETARDLGLEGILEELTTTHLRPALQAAGVENPEQYSLAYEPASAKRYRRPWVGVEAYDATQVLPVVQEGA